MNRARKIVAVLCVAGSAATFAGLDWFFEQLIPTSPPARFGYVPPVDANATNDLATIQKGWPQSLSTSEERTRFRISMREMKQAELPATTATAMEPKSVAPIDLGTLLVQASIEDGIAKSRVCMSCHDFSKDGPNRIGPNLWGVVGANVAEKPGYDYSPALAAAQGSWTYDRLFEYLASPRRSIPGTKMSFAGIRDPADRAAVIRYLSKQGENAPAFPKPLPDEPELTVN
jgi:cytochrome c